MKITISLPHADRLRGDELRAFHEHVQQWFRQRPPDPPGPYVHIAIEQYLDDVLDERRRLTEAIDKAQAALEGLDRAGCQDPAAARLADAVEQLVAEGAG